MIGFRDVVVIPFKEKCYELRPFTSSGLYFEKLMFCLCLSKPET